MTTDKRFRELNFSSSQLVVVFIAILILGVFVFLLGVSVGKKHSVLAANAGESSLLKTEAVAEKKPQLGEPTNATVQQELDARQQMKKDSQKTGVHPEKKTEAQTALKPDLKSATADDTAGRKPDINKAKPTPAEKPPAGQAGSALKSGIFYIQIGALGDKQSADAFAKKVENEGFPVLVLVPLPTDKRAIFRIRIGPYATKQEAEDAKTKIAVALKKKKSDYFLVKG
jgi:cell division septation protein DedD